MTLKQTKLVPCSTKALHRKRRYCWTDKRDLFDSQFEVSLPVFMQVYFYIELILKPQQDCTPLSRYACTGSLSEFKSFCNFSALFSNSKWQSCEAVKTSVCFYCKIQTFHT